MTFDGGAFEKWKPKVGLRTVDVIPDSFSIYLHVKTICFEQRGTPDLTEVLFISAFTLT